MDRIRPAPLDDEIVRIHARSFGYVLAHVHGMFSARLSDALAGTGLHMGHVVVLATLRAQRELHQESTLTQTRLAEASGIEKSSLVMFLDALEKDGWVERLRHPTDRRAHIVHLTESGSARFDGVGVRLQQRQQEILSVFTMHEQVDLLRQMTRLMHHLQES
ncbi:MAG: MarR family transcriptional regulator [Asticcacaulis sp.]|nr:MarR family transcriptional regulator [Asticcacaulis sp.]